MIVLFGTDYIHLPITDLKLIAIFRFTIIAVLGTAQALDYVNGLSIKPMKVNCCVTKA